MTRHTLAERLEALERAQRNASSTPQLGHSSMHDGKILEYQGESLVQTIGTQADGTHTVTQTNGPTPPAPSAANVTVSPGAATIVWDGTLIGAQAMPLDAARIDLHLTASPAVNPLTTPAVGSILPGTWGSLALPLEAGTYYAHLVLWTTSGQYAVSDPSSPFTVEEVSGGGGPSEAPTVAPAFTVSPHGIGVLKVDFPDIDPALLPVVEVAASLTSPVAEDGSDTVGTSAGSTFFIASIDGEQIPFDAPTYVKVRVTNGRGDGPWSAEQSATPRQADNDFISSLYAYLGTIEAGRITSGNLDANVALVGQLAVGSLMDLKPPTSVSDGAGGFTLLGGFTILDPANPSGEPLVRLHPGGCTFRGKLVADIVTVLQDLVINGNARLSGGSTFTLTNGVPDPLAGPTWTIDTGYGQAWPAAPSGYTRHGFDWDAANNRWIEGLLRTSTNRMYARTVSTSGVAGSLFQLLQGSNPPNATGGWPVTLQDNYGIAVAGGAIFFARKGTSAWGSGSDYTESVDSLYLYKCAMDGTALDREDIVPPHGDTMSVTTVGLGSAGSSVFIAYTGGFGFGARVQERTSGGMNLANEFSVSGDIEFDAGVLVGNFDFGAARTITAGLSGLVRAYLTTTGAYQAADSFSLHGTTSGKSIHWDGTKFLSLTSGESQLRVYSGYRPNNDSTWSAVYADKTSGGTTKASPATTVNVPARRFAALTLGPLPVGASGSDVWVGYAASGNAATKYKRAESLSARTMVLTALRQTTGSTTVPSTSTAGGSPALLKSGATPGWTLSGDGTAKQTRTPTDSDDLVPKSYADALAEPVSGAGGVTAATSYTISNVTLFKVGKVVHFLISVARSSNPPNSGYITFATLPAGYRPAITTPLNAGVQSVAVTWTPKAQVLSDGQAQIAMNPSGGSANAMNVTGTWVVAS